MIRPMTGPMTRWLALCFVVCVIATATRSSVAFGASGPSPVLGLAFDLFSPIMSKRKDALKALAKRGKRDAVAALILALRYQGLEQHEIHTTLKTITGAKTNGSWHAWMIWQEQNADVKAFDGFESLISAVLTRHDANFARFFYRGMPHEIRLGEIAWGGVVLDGIPSLDNPQLTAAKDATYLNDDDLVFGVAINGDVRAYPLRIMNWHEMFNDVIGGVPVALAYCTLCGSGILFETTVKDRETPFVFGSSGFLYRSNKLMYDRQTYTLWNQFTGRPVAGPLTGSGIELKTRPVAITTWKDWKAANPDTRVMSSTTGFQRDYSPGAAYGSYFSSPDLMFPADTSDKRLKPKDYVFALRGSTTDKAWPLSRFAQTPVINDTAGVLQLTLVGDSKTRTVRAYQTRGEAFAPGTTPRTLKLGSDAWRITEAALVGPDGKTFPRLPGHVAYWFAWSGYLGQAGQLGVAE